MSADFWAGYISGAAGIILGNPLDVLKVRLQAGITTATPSFPITPPSATLSTPLSYSYARPFLLGTAAPVLGYGALNALLFVSYNRTEAFLNQLSGCDTGGGAPQGGQARGTNLLTTWLAGAVGGLATWVVSTPTELVKCRAQLQIPASPAPPATPSLTHATGSIHGLTPSPSPSSSPFTTSSWHITKTLLQTHGPRGLYAGGAVTALRDTVGYGFYFWGYELCSRGMRHLFPPPTTSISTTTATTTTTTLGDGSSSSSSAGMEAARVLLCGGLAGIITWASIFPLDVVKTRVQTQVLGGGGGNDRVVAGERAPLLGAAGGGGGGRGGDGGRPLGAWEVARQTYREGGMRPFFRGLGVCSVRAFIVNAVQWAVYEWVMAELGQGRRDAREGQEVGAMAV
ncbi:mitochondrial carrier domain-containing protein [Chaetomium fimeti]|uniref:Mitochondrial carrier domain-containing protein n=1 Tax=Chaetomium fimeti TaxID=1854472 RepID=A0AAE0HSC1_9PEZI|nr:mitochondrial carrier domain-containing protein [Chaetomium fimeti]